MHARTRLLIGLAALALALGPVPGLPSVQAAGLTVSAPAPTSSPLSSPLAWLGGGLAIFGAIKVKDANVVASKFKTRASAAAGDYKTGVEQAGSDWEAGARAGEGNYEQGVQEAIGKKRYGRGIAQAGAAKYTRNASVLGATRYPQGIQNAEQAYASGVAPVLDKLRGLNLPPRGPRRSPQNQDRANMVARELGKLKDGQ